MPNEALEFKADLAHRLRWVDGRLQGIIGMLEAGAACPDILRQLLAAHSALGEVNRRLVAHHLQNCLPLGVYASDPVIQERALEEVATLYDLISGHTGPLIRKELA